MRTGSKLLTFVLGFIPLMAAACSGRLRAERRSEPVGHEQQAASVVKPEVPEACPKMGRLWSDARRISLRELLQSPNANMGNAVRTSGLVEFLRDRSVLIDPVSHAFIFLDLSHVRRNLDLYLACQYLLVEVDGRVEMKHVWQADRPVLVVDAMGLTAIH